MHDSIAISLDENFSKDFQISDFQREFSINRFSIQNFQIFYKKWWLKLGWSLEENKI